ncbi:MAG TPA: hypothetical protein VLF69_01445 [Candidatus Saccharimonadales bacterium]|nr:hypothetical protein [Candidatus Saccharimonadales bacterium]
MKRALAVGLSLGLALPAAAACGELGHNRPAPVVSSAGDYYDSLPLLPEPKLPDAVPPAVLRAAQALVGLSVQQPDGTAIDSNGVQISPTDVLAMGHGVRSAYQPDVVPLRFHCGDVAVTEPTGKPTGHRSDGKAVYGDTVSPRQVVYEYVAPSVLGDLAVLRSLPNSGTLHPIARLGGNATLRTGQLVYEVAFGLDRTGRNLTGPHNVRALTVPKVIAGMVVGTLAGDYGFLELKSYSRDLYGNQGTVSGNSGGELVDPRSGDVVALIEGVPNDPKHRPTNDTIATNYGVRLAGPRTKPVRFAYAQPLRTADIRPVLAAIGAAPICTP